MHLPIFCGIVQGKMSSSGHHCMSGIYNIGHCVMPWLISNCEQRSGTCLFSIDTAPECIL